MIPTSHAIDAKSGLSKGAMAESFLVSLYRCLAPYRGCGHGCAYCDGRAEKYFVEGEFDKEIGTRLNLPEVVASDIHRGVALSEYGALCIGSGVTDVYQGLERKLELTRRTLEALIPSKLPLVILTKNKLILRDFDLLKQFPRVLVVVTVTTLDRTHSGVLEPGASPPEARLGVVKAAKEAGFFSGVMAMPLCPGITDSKEQFQQLLSGAKLAGADFVMPGGLTLRPGRQKEHFLSRVQSHFPSLMPLYDEVYQENRPSGMPLIRAMKTRMNEWHAELDKENIASFIPHWVYRELLSPPDALGVLFSHMQSLYDAKGVDTRPLRKATEHYAAWLQQERTALRRKRFKVVALDPFPITRMLTEKLQELCSKGHGGFESICKNKKLSQLVCTIINENRTFDYITLHGV